MAEAQARNIAARATREAARALAASVVSVGSAVASSLASAGDNDAFDLGDVTEIDGESTSLGGAAPFEYIESATGDDVLSIAARGVSEAHEAGCFAEYESELDFCNALAPPIGGARATALCKQNAFDRYQQCRGY